MKNALRKTGLTALALIIGAGTATAVCINQKTIVPKQVLAAEDYRSHAHGMNFIRNPETGKSWLIWSEAYDTGEMEDGSWTHDVYMQSVDTATGTTGKKECLVSAYEAQEPASASVAGDGNVMVTFEDGNDAGDYTLAQRYLLMDQNMKVTKKYPQTVAMGGHSGHCASTDDYHVVFWNNDWVDGGGVDNLGTGKDLYVTSMKTDGSEKHTLTVSDAENTRDWWPQIAASEDKTLLVWQRYVDDENYSRLCYGIYNPAANKMQILKANQKSKRVLNKLKLKYYTYTVNYLEDQECFVIGLTTYGNKGMLIKLDLDGNITETLKNLPPIVREVQPAVREDGNTSLLCYPSQQGGVFYVRISQNKMACKSVKKNNYKWNYCGTSGFFTDDGDQVCFATLGIDEKEMKTYSVPKKLQ